MLADVDPKPNKVDKVKELVKEVERCRHVGRALRREYNDAQVHEPEYREWPDGLEDRARALRRRACGKRCRVPGW